MTDAATDEVEPVVLSIQVGVPETRGALGAADPMERPWTSGMVKHPVEGPVWLGRTNLAGDGQADLINHGGPDKAVLAYAAAHYPGWRVELAPLELPFGAFGENLTIAGQDESSVCIGDVYAVGTAVVQVSQPRQPCWKLARRWAWKDLTARVQRTGRGGWYLRVLEEGTIQAGERLVLRDRPCTEWTVALANDLMFGRRDDREALAALADCPLLAASWREELRERLARSR
jgi:MOSC domain-containing protein YiiM